MKKRLGLFPVISVVVAVCAGLTACATLPVATQSLPFSLTSTFGDRSIIEFDVNATGEIRVEATWSGTAGQLALILNGPGQVGYYKRVDGGHSLVVVQTVTQQILSRGTGWRATITNFDTNGEAQGTLTVRYPPPSAGASAQAPLGTMGDELIVNGDFSDGLTNWSQFTQNGAAATYSAADGAAIITIEQTGKSGGDIQLSQNQPGFAVVDGATYRLQFDARSTAETKLTVTISENGTDVNKDGFAYSPHATASFQVGEEVTTFAADMKVKGSNPGAGLLFLLGRCTGEVSISNVSLRQEK